MCDIYQFLVVVQNSPAKIYVSLLVSNDVPDEIGILFN